MKNTSVLLAAFSALILAGCSSKEAMDYLPDSANYVGVDAKQIRTEAGAKRVSEMIRKMDPNAPPDNEKLTRIYFAMDPKAGFYGVMLGEAGMSAMLIDTMKKNKATESKIDGTNCVTLNGMGMTALTDSSILMFAPTNSLTTMKNTAKKKNPGAADSPIFKKLTRTLPGHAVAFAINAKPILAMADRGLAGVAMMNPKGVEALKSVDSLTMTLDWDQAPEAAGTFYLPGDDARKDLVSIIDMAKTMAASQQGAVGQAGALLSNLTVTPGSEGTDFSLKIPAETANTWLDGIEKVAASLPTDPRERQMAIQKAFMQK